MHYKWKEIIGSYMQNNQWKIEGDQHLIKGHPIEIRNNSNGGKIQTHSTIYKD